ncbi:MAG: alpha-amylase family glycosyl hydrolase [Gammaproteobacteria bacterium]|nr:alpha-amylase family glycosyl hydrolase [Gammaproteobacteria bacterium]
MKFPSFINRLLSRTPTGDNSQTPAAPNQGSHSSHIEWLKSRSMLLKYEPLIQSLAGKSIQWQYAFGNSRPEDALKLSSVWFAAYPDSLMGCQGAKVLEILGTPQLHQTLSEIGIQAIHTGPMKRSGSITGTEYGSSIDGNFDRIEQLVDPSYGDQSQYQEMVSTARQHGIAIIGDLVPGHTGKGPDFRLAEQNVPGFTGLFTMIEIDPKDWPVLPPIPPGEDSVNLSQSLVQTLKQRGYGVIGPLDAEVFARPEIKESSWSVTDIVRGVDGQDRRWAYLHIFKEGQPSLNWSDPSFAAHRLLTADLLHSLQVLGTRGLRLDATMFLGIESRPDPEKGWLAGHPLSTQVTNMLGMMIRKFGGFSFQELNVDLDKVKESLSSGPEFNYDFTTRPAYLYALVVGDGGPLRLMLRQMLEYEIQPIRMVHGLQNHDELMLETTHLNINGGQEFDYEGTQERGDRLFEQIHQTVIRKTTGDHAPYNQVFAMSPGICSTLPGLIAATLDIPDLSQITPEQIEQIKRIHLLAAAYNALQAGVFVLSGWDLVGALPIPMESVKELVADNDSRWINRGGYDLMGIVESEDRSIQGLPKARSLYGSLPDQLQNRDSFAFLLKSLLSLRDSLGIAQSELVAVPSVTSEGVVILVNKLPRAEGKTQAWQISALNFAKSPIKQKLEYSDLNGVAKALWSNIQGAISESLSYHNESLTLELSPLEARLIVVS